MKLIIIPARLNSSRFPYKVLAPIGLEPLFVHVYNNLCKAINKSNPLLIESGNYFRIVVASPDKGVIEFAKRFNIDGIYTPDTVCGTHSVLSAAKQLEWEGVKFDDVINWQADYPEVKMDLIMKLISNMDELCSDIHTPFYWSTDDNPNNVKIVSNFDDEALYFSRSPVPYNTKNYKIHVGIYGFPAPIVDRVFNFYKGGHTITNNCENLEQLLWLEKNQSIHLIQTEPVVSINTRADYENYVSGRERESNTQQSTR